MVYGGHLKLGPSQLGGGLVMLGGRGGGGGGGASVCHNFGSWCNSLLGDIYLTSLTTDFGVTLQKNEILWLNVSPVVQSSSPVQ